MPIEIRELVIRVTVEKEKKRAESGGAGSVKNSTEQLVAECVDQVLEVLSSQRER